MRVSFSEFPRGVQRIRYKYVKIFLLHNGGKIRKSDIKMRFENYQNFFNFHITISLWRLYEFFVVNNAKSLGLMNNRMNAAASDLDLRAAVQAEAAAGS